jgi:ArsR family transcriptional regulator, cadmium/lead-responsive transcriptional repressor
VTDPQPVFAALADPTRRAVFERLSARGPASASALARELPVSRQAIAKHLAVLDDAGLVERRSAGRAVEYRASPDALGEVASWMARVGTEWDDRLRNLRKAAEG